MLDYKLISGDCHITEHSDAFLRCEQEFGEKAPRVADDPEDLGKGLWYLMEGLEPMRVGYLSLGHVVDKPEGRKNMSIYEDAEGFKQLVSDFRENYRYEDYLQDWEPSAYCRELDRDNVEG